MDLLLWVRLRQPNHWGVKIMLAGQSGRAACCRSICLCNRHLFDAIFRSELTEAAGTRRALQPSALSECRKINSRSGIPPTRAVAGAKLQSDLLVAIGNP